MKSKRKTLISIGALIFHLALFYVVYEQIKIKPALKSPVEHRAEAPKQAAIRP